MHNPLEPKHSLPHRQLRQLDWAPARQPPLLCASTATEVLVFVVSMDEGSGPTPLQPARVLSFPSTVDWWTWEEDSSLLVLSGNGVHRFGLEELLAPGKGGEGGQLPSETSLAGPFGGGRGLVLGVVGGGAERRMVLVTEECGLEQYLQQRQSGQSEGINTTLLELRRSQRQPAGAQPVADMREKEEWAGKISVVEAVEPGSAGGVLDLVGKLGLSSNRGESASSIPAGLLLNRSHDQRPSQQQQQQQQQQQGGTLWLARVPPHSAPLSACLAPDSSLASVPLPYAPTMTVTSGPFVVVGSHFSSTLLAYRQDGQLLEALKPLALPEHYRPRGLTMDHRHVYCFATRRLGKEEEEEGGSRPTPVRAGWAWYDACLCSFLVAERAEEQQQEEEEEESDHVLALLSRLRGEVLGRLDALDERMARLEARFEK